MWQGSLNFLIDWAMKACLVMVRLDEIVVDFLRFLITVSIVPFHVLPLRPLPYALRPWLYSHAI